MNRFFAEGGEFALIEHLFGSDHFSRDARGLGDDAFLFEPAPGSKWVVTTDSSVEGVHFRLDWTSPERALRKALMANLSDINAMGGISRYAFFNLGARPEWGHPEFEQMGRILREMEESIGFKVSGGDTVRTSGPGFFAFTLMGEVEGFPLLRSACKPGHKIFVSGRLGGSAAGLDLLKEGKTEKGDGKPEGDLIRMHFDPNPPLKLGPMLASLGKLVAAIDISDGLSSELWHLARQSGCSLRVERSKLPLHPALQAVCGEQASRMATDGGEEYQLLFTGNFSDDELSRMSDVVPITEIGVVAEGDGVFWTEGGVLSPLPPGVGLYYNVGLYTEARGGGTDFVFDEAQFLTGLALGLPAAALAAALIAATLGSLVLSMRGHYFAICTLGLGIAAGQIAAGIPWIGAGSGMLTPNPPASLGDVGLLLYYLALGLAVLCAGTFAFLLSTRFGLTLNAIRDDEDKAEAMGLPTRAAKVTAWTIAAAFLGVAGALYGNLVRFIDPVETAFAGATIGVWMILMALLGGKGTLLGPIVGAIVFQVTKELFWTYLLGWQRVALGVLIVLVAVFFPSGIVGFFRERARERGAQGVADA